MPYDNIVIQPEQDSILSGDIRICQEVVEDVILQRPEAAKGYFQSVLFWFPDYDEDTREVYEVPEVRAWLQKVDQEFPYFFYFVMPEQYVLYVASQTCADGTGLTLQALRLYLAGHEDPIKELCIEIGDDYEAVSAKIGAEIRKMTQSGQSPECM
ncbi:MAG: hypothetical protein A3F84_18425 [Candidatus Handelsmanbacteria bacterium RIFCSPLOWO2_12_FULL_64_10]|uniref:Uncharacterized protein n=1 Tax=Handelsmanbacteria sp. (strain RIFCSPLOWO2_12_FULL_64_10) TaxID=1817868 RepID=A0A1F6C994_HANXR|nr:MAG: hypothetical protein A3F84_18425 [Candidatus Handelsmanbacteria bacterium RIFCSPLOWO2_12_FULL_64_10]